MTVIAQNKIDILVGLIAPFGMSSVPTGWLACDGSAVSRTTYADLFTAIGTTWGAGDGSSTFALPDLEGAFLRGTGGHGTHQMATEGGSDHFTGPSVGSFEDDQFQGHFHRYNYHRGMFNNGSDTYVDALNNTSLTDNVTNRVQIALTDGTNGTPRTGDETRPFNAGVKYCIKY
jgi:microcystin-dependent protein